MQENWQKMVKNDQNTSFWEKKAKNLPFWLNFFSNSGNLLNSPIPVSHNFLQESEKINFWLI